MASSVLTYTKEYKMILDKRCLPEWEWRKATYSTGNGACVEVASSGEFTAVRDSQDPAGPVMLCSQVDWHQLVTRIKMVDIQWL